MNPRRVLAGASVSATGGVVVALGARAMLDGFGSVFDLVLAALGIVVGLSLVGAGALLITLREELSTPHVVRVAGWNALGVVVLGLVLVLVLASPSVQLPPYVIANVLGVSAVAHVLIGVNDVRRIRVAELAREREKLAVLNRITRHNLRNDTQVMMGYAEALADRAPDEESRELAERLSAQASELATMNEKLGRFQSAVETDVERNSPLPLLPLVDAVRSDLRSTYPDATIEVDVPEVSVAAGENLRAAIREAVENGIVHGESVTIAATEVDGTVEIRVSDEGPGIPQNELTPLQDDQEITQLEHGTGLGLWILKTVVDAHEGELDFQTSDTGTTVCIGLPSA